MRPASGFFDKVVEIRHGQEIRNAIVVRSYSSRIGEDLNYPTGR